LVGRLKKKVHWRISLANIRVIKKGINVSKILKQLHQYPEDWGAQKNMEGAGDLVNDQGFPAVQAGVLQLVVGVVATKEEYVGDSEMSSRTPAYNRHTDIVGFLKRNFKKFDRCGFLSLPIGGEVGQHIDIGSYYQTRDRYHLAIQGSYVYTVGGESVKIDAGDLIWFNNKLSHGTKNVGDVVRITFVFDVPHSKNNP
jgi:mannose-6-phosphate isomerase-like protein (cupin superfamily)